MRQWLGIELSAYVFAVRVPYDGGLDQPSPLRRGGATGVGLRRVRHCSYGAKYPSRAATAVAAGLRPAAAAGG